MSSEPGMLLESGRDAFALVTVLSLCLAFSLRPSASFFSGGFFSGGDVRVEDDKRDLTFSCRESSLRESGWTFSATGSWVSRGWDGPILSREDVRETVEDWILSERPEGVATPSSSPTVSSSPSSER